MTGGGQQDLADDNAIAVTGAAGRFPRAADLDTFWRNLCAGVESTTEFTDDDLLRSGVPAEALTEPRLVRRRPVLDDVDLFDAQFFGYTPREAETIDPQQRIFLECAWEALESAGHDTRRIDGAVGVFGGGGPDLYYLSNILPNESFLARIGHFGAMLGNEKDFFALRVSYKLDLHGPSISVLTGCSSSLVSVHLAVQSLLSGESDFALAGGATIFLPQRAGYLHSSGGVNSPDGRCRAFDAAADGTVPGDAAAVVVLRRLADALADGDPILGVIRGSAVNNDGADKVGFTAPSVTGQADVIAEALAVAGVDPQTVGYVETHGTGTPLGDAIEIAALTQAFDTDRRQFCRIGTLKPNIGHTDTASGVAGLIKILLAFRHETLPPSLNCAEPNPQIGFAATPFRVNTELSPWPADGPPRRAGVSSFAVGGTNAHVVVEEPPRHPAAPPAGRPAVLLLVSGRTPAALDDARARLAAHLDDTSPDAAELADIAWTTQVGRAEFDHRLAVTAGDAATASLALRAGGAPRPGSATAAGSAAAVGGATAWRGSPGTDRAGVAFLFPGQGSQYPGMAGGLYETEAVFRATVDDCAHQLAPILGLDLRGVLHPDLHPDLGAGAQALLARTELTQPALFVVEYALARQLAAWGIRPTATFGHSLGEFVSATLAGVFDLDTALRLVAARGRLIAALPGGAMAAVALSEAEVTPWLDGTPVNLAAVNSAAQTVLSGPQPALGELTARLRAAGIASTPLRTSHAFHSAMMDPAVAPFVAEVRAAAPQAPHTPFVSGVTGTWITAEQATDPAYWGRQLREPVRFTAGIATLRATPDLVLAEVGPGAALARAADALPTEPALAPASGDAAASGGTAREAVLVSLGPARDARSGGADLLGLLGRLWLRGVRPDWAAVHADAPRRRTRIPTYPFQHSRHWVEPPGGPRSLGTGTAPAGTAAGTRAVPVDPPVPHRSGASPGSDPHGGSDPHAGLTPHGGFDAASGADEYDTDDATPIEAELRRGWRDVMGLTAVGRHDNFFDLGGHSLLAAQIVTRIEAAYPIRISVAEILGGVPTVAGMAETVERLLYERLDTMSDEEAERLLASMADPAGRTPPYPDPDPYAQPADPAVVSGQEQG
ncbi:type I polyketide synthase [Frankia tisae]|uniref:type I polyketide synthase n=1 Tax=Frankia tisae TaxID=2950104 RepID=UPI0021C0B0B2|nr:type I polyketide synthase [Frankia tisae]